MTYDLIIPIAYISIKWWHETNRLLNLLKNPLHSRADDSLCGENARENAHFPYTTTGNTVQVGFYLNNGPKDNSDTEMVQ